MSAVDVVTALLFALGGAFVFIGGIGALRLPDVYTRIHAAGLTDTLGPIFVLAGCMLQAEGPLAALKLAAILVFLLLTTPTATHALANAARLANVRPVRIAHGKSKEAERP